MPPPKHVGVLVDRYNNETDVWYHPDIAHITIMIGDSQDGDFPVGQPCRADPQQVLADSAYQEWLVTKRLVYRRADVHLDDNADDDAVIEPFDAVDAIRPKYAH